VDTYVLKFLNYYHIFRPLRGPDGLVVVFQLTRSYATKETEHSRTNITEINYLTAADLVFNFYSERGVERSVLTRNGGFVVRLELLERFLVSRGLRHLQSVELDSLRERAALADGHHIAAGDVPEMGENDTFRRAIQRKPFAL
jgi:hypothetical protein